MVEGRHDLTESQWYGLAPALRTAQIAARFRLATDSAVKRLSILIPDRRAKLPPPEWHGGGCPGKHSLHRTCTQFVSVLYLVLTATLAGNRTSIRMNFHACRLLSRGVRGMLCDICLPGRESIKQRSLFRASSIRFVAGPVRNRSVWFHDDGLPYTDRSGKQGKKVVLPALAAPGSVRSASMPSRLSQPSMASQASSQALPAPAADVPPASRSPASRARSAA